MVRGVIRGVVRGVIRGVFRGMPRGVIKVRCYCVRVITISHFADGVPYLLVEGWLEAWLGTWLGAWLGAWLGCVVIVCKL